MAKKYTRNTPKRRYFSAGETKVSKWFARQRMALQRKTSPHSFWGKTVRFYNRHRTVILDILKPTLMVLLGLIILMSLRQINNSNNYGIDVSMHQGKVEWSKVRQDGVTFAMIRCGYRSYGTGKLYQDSQYKRNMRNANLVGIHRGVYFYSQAVTAAEAREEAETVLGWLHGANLDYPVYIDVEDTGTNGQGRADGLSVSQRTAAVKAFCKTIEAGGYKAGVYSNSYYLTYRLDLSQLSAYSVWVANYVTGSKPNFSGDYDLWQYSSTGTVSGVSGAVDLDRYAPLMKQ